MSLSSFIFEFLVASLFVAGVLGCNKQCSKKDDKPAVKNPENEMMIISEIVNIINDVCKQEGKEGGPMCNHTAELPAGVFMDIPVKIILRYSGIELDKNENELHQNKGSGLVTASISFKYQNFSITVEDSDSIVVINSTDNQFETTFTLKLPSGDGNENNCFFEWNHIEVERFAFTKSIIKPGDNSDKIASKFDKEQLQEAFNSKPLLEYLNKEMSVCNKISFLHDITSAFILILVLKGLGSALGGIFNDFLCA